MGGRLPASVARSQAKEILEREYKRRHGDIVTAYNDAHDGRLLRFLGIEPGAKMPVREYLERVNAALPEFAKLCSHPGEDSALRLTNLRQGFAKLGIGCAE